MGQKLSTAAFSTSGDSQRAAVYEYSAPASVTSLSPLGRSGNGKSFPSRPVRISGSRPGTPKLGNSGHSTSSSRRGSIVDDSEQLRLEEACRYLLAAGSLIHALQAERGASTIFIASGGTRAKVLLGRARGSTDTAMTRLRKTSLFRRKRIEEQLRGDLAAARKSMDQTGSSMSHFKVQDTFEGFIERLLASASWVREELPTSSAEGAFTAYIIFARIKESHGQLRGRVGSILASGNPSLANGQYQKLLEVRGQMRAYTTSFKEAVPHPFRPLPQKFLDKCASIPSQMKEFETKLMTSQADTEEILTIMSLEEWYTVMTARMDSMAEVHSALAMEIRGLERGVTGDSSQPEHSEGSFASDEIDLVEGIKWEGEFDMQEVIEKEWHIGLDHLLLQRELGRGQSATVYLGEWEQQRVAVKVIQSSAMAGACNSVKEFCREVQVLSKLRHPNVCTFHGANFSPPRFFMVLEYMDRGTLYDVLRSKPHTIDFVSMSIQLARGMKYLHEKGEMIHRDLKSPNILLNSQGQLKIVDFGLTLAGHAQHNNKTAEVGTLRWMAPEVMTREPYSYSADVYSFGIILWELITKDIPWRSLEIDGRLPPLAVFQAMQDQRRPVIPEGTPRKIRKLVDLCWHANPESRPTFGEILTRLEEAFVTLSKADVDFLQAVHIDADDSSTHTGGQNKRVSKLIQESDISRSSGLAIC